MKVAIYARYSCDDQRDASIAGRLRICREFAARQCGVCGAGFFIAERNRLACFGAREKGTCSNHLTIRRDEVDARVLKALEEKLLNRELFEEFCDESTRDMNRLRMQHRASFSAAERETERIEVRRKKLIEMVMNGVAPPSEVRDEMNANAARREALKAKLAAADGPPPLLHPEMPGSTAPRSQSSPHRSRSRTAGRRPPRGDEASWTPSCSRQARTPRRFKSSRGGIWRPCSGPPYKRRGRRNPTTSPLQVFLVAGARSTLNWSSPGRRREVRKSQDPPVPTVCWLAS